MSQPSVMDNVFMKMCREHIHEFRVSRFVSGRGLEIGPENDLSIRPIGIGSMDTLGLTPNCTYQADITRRTPIADSTYDFVFCMEVLEHTLNPFAAIAEIRRILKPGGLLIASAPYNVREHGPRPDCWRFGRNGWTVLLRDWDDVQLDVLMTPDRFLMPLHICASARCNKTKATQDNELVFPLENT